jgi:hypothetical protein
MVGLATVLYLAGAFALLTADEPWTTRMAIVQTAALFGCGVLIVRRTATPVIGWLLVVPGVTFNLIYAFQSGDMFDGAADGWVMWLTPLSNLGILALAILLLVFPTGRLESTASRVLAGWAVLGQLGVIALEVLVIGGVLDVAAQTGFEFMNASFFVVVVGGLVEQVRRYRTRPRLEQQQVKWFLVAIAGQSAYVVTTLAGFEPGSVTFLVVDNLATMLWPVTILIAISRYRLYEIDRIVSRTLGYGLVVAMLAVIGVGGVVGVTSLLPTQDRLAVALSTVAVVALFDPVRRRVVDVVDRRFDRTQYVARQVVEGFGREVRDVTDVGQISGRVEAVVSRTVAPTTVAVWQPPGTS